MTCHLLAGVIPVELGGVFHEGKLPLCVTQ